MKSKQKSPSQKQCNLESFVNLSDDCIIIPDTADEYTESSPVSIECIRSPTLLITPISKRTPPLYSKETPVETPGSKDVELYVSLDALAIARNAENQGIEDVQICSPKSVESPLTSPIMTEDRSKSAVKRKPRKPRTKSEMAIEWDKLQEERREVTARKKEIDKIKSDLEREREKLRKQIERNEEREHEKELKALERDAKLKRKEEMLDLRNKEREMKLKLKETQLQEKENDRNRTEEDRIRKKAEQERFKSFFVSKPNSLKRHQNIVYQCDTRFVPFQLKDNTRLAIFPSKQIDYEEFDAYLSLETHEFDSNTLLAEMKYRRSHNRQRDCQPMELQAQNENDIMIVTAGEKMGRGAQPLTFRFKLLQFKENQRPAYFGTFFKRSSLVTGRRPLGRDSTIMDYEVDSDEEWEPDDPDAESIKSNDSDEDVSGSQNESDSEDGFFVPHGYLSEDEGHASEENETDCFEREREPLASFEEKRKQKLQAKEEAWLSEISQKCQPLKPFIISRLNTLQLSADSLAKLSRCTAVLLVDDPLDTILTPGTPGTATTRHKSVPDMINTTALPYFIQYIHEENIGVDRAVMQFCIFWNEHYLPSKYLETQTDQLNNLKINKSRLIKTMHKIARKVDNKVWLVNEEFSCTKMLDVNVKNEIRKLFPSKTNNKLYESCNEKTVPSSPGKEHNPKPLEIIKLSSPKFALTLTKLINNEIPQNEVSKIESKPISSFKRKSLSEMRANVVTIIPQTPISPPEVSEIKRVKLSTSSTSIEEINTSDSPLKLKQTESRRLALGVAQTDSKGTCIHVWK